jgi:tetraacyldisaccharide 4'-kinase
VRAPEFWRHHGPVSLALAPLGALFALGGGIRRRLASPRRIGVPVIVIGNLVAGGAGKTPVAMSLASEFRRRGQAVHCLTRGYGGRLAGPLRVDPRLHSADEVGDEALLLAAQTPTWVAQDRLAGAEAAAAGADMLVLDDGFQNPGLVFDLSLVVVDGGYGFGNGMVMPAGPLREAIGTGLARADAIVLMGEDETDAVAAIGAARPDLPILRARLVPGSEGDGYAGRRVYAFAGIGRPEKFFRTLSDLRAEVVGRASCADHHRYAPDEIMRIVEAASAVKAVPVTTAKDFVRLPPEARAMVEVLTVTVAWKDPVALDRVLARVSNTELRSARQG